jgi:hypothetical protein
MSDIIDKEATFVGDMHRALFALSEENRMLRDMLRCSGCEHEIAAHDDSGCVLEGCDCRRYKPRKIFG